VRLGVDAREIQDGVVTGIGRSLANFISYFAAHESNHELVLFAEKKLPIPINSPCREAIIPCGITFHWDQWRLCRHLEMNRIDLFYSPYYKLPLLSRIPAINQVLDLMYLVFPSYLRELGILGRIYYATIGRACAHKAINIITDSEHAKRDIVRLWGIKPDKIAVIPLGLADRYSPVKDKERFAQVIKKFALPERYLLYLGNFKPHKNVVSLVRAFAMIKEEIKDLKLVLAGPLDSHGENLRRQVKDLGLDKDVVFTGMIREDDLPEVILSLADIFVFPSLYEGFGIPPLEAMACGTPVVTSNLTAIPEVVGEAGLLVNPLNIDELARAILSLLNNRDLHGRYAEMGLARAKQFHSEQTAGRLYRHIIHLLEASL
jgi:glycosyltransferase involved in cell wall biosynthesis